LAGNDRIDSRYLRRFPEFVEFQRSDSGEEKEDAEKAREVAATSETTPEELILRLPPDQTALASDLLDRVRAASPAFFERLVVQLMVAMGRMAGLSKMQGRRSANPETRE
jgi:restriction system protein